MTAALQNPFADFSDSIRPQTPLRAAITAATRRAEPECVAALLPLAAMPADESEKARTLAKTLIIALRGKKIQGAVDGLIREYDLSSQEGVALMCLAEALLRIPDTATRDALIRDKIGGGDWRAHLGHSPSVFVNAATWGLVVTGKLTGTANETGLGSALTRLIGRGGEPLIRRGVDMAMRMMGEQFVTGETIAGALANSKRMEAQGFRYSYDMLGEAATTAADATRYYDDYEQAIHAIGRAAEGRGIVEGPGISVKLSALHPRYLRAQYDRVMSELYPKLRALAILARHYDIGLNIDAEETERLDLSLDMLELLCLDGELKGWNGIGFVVQAYQKRAPFVLDFVIDLARRTGHRLMLRLVKGAYWDSEIKRAQVGGQDDFPVFTRKSHTDVSYLACAKKLLAAPDAVFPQFATHNAYTVAAVHRMAGETFTPDQYEFQCLHGMGEPLYGHVVGPEKLGRPCRIYAPVGTHETLLAYLVRRLLENGANSSFVNRIQDPALSIDELAADPVAAVASSSTIGAPHEKLDLPRDIFGAARKNSRGLDLSNEMVLADLAASLQGDPIQWRAGEGANLRPVPNPADHRDIVGHVAEPGDPEVDAAIASAESAAAQWRDTPPTGRAGRLERAADLMEQRMASLIGLAVREAGKSYANAVAEVREAVDFLRYYAAEVRANFHNETHVPLGPVVCISPWNFPLAIFTGQVAAALAAGNPVLAKPAEETPLIAAQAVAILHEAGIPRGALHLLPGDGAVGARLVADKRVQGVMFTGSTDVARLIARKLSERLGASGEPVPLIAETGGQNALVVDSSALAEQVVADVLASAFDSAGQRCSALRVLCLQDDVAGRILSMLEGALAELSIGNPAHLSTDIGPVISAEARERIETHVESMRGNGHRIHWAALPKECERGTFVAPTIIEIEHIAQLREEVFGPVLHVLRFRRDKLDALMADIAATGYALTFGVHSRIDETIARVVSAAAAGNIYVNRNLIGAVVGAQPFGGHGLSGTGPKAGGPLYLRRLLSSRPALPFSVGVDVELPGPVGERNIYRLEPRGTALCIAASEAALERQFAAARAAGCRPVVGDAQTACDVILHDGDDASLRAVNHSAALRDGPIVQVYATGTREIALDGLVRERSVSIDTTAAGGNANLMMIG